MTALNDTVPTTNRTIFLAEDDIDDQEFLAEALRSLDATIQLRSFTSGLKFIEHLDKTDDEGLPCLIILDYNIPELNGAEILRVLNTKSRYNHIAKIIWSTSGSEKFKRSCLDLGAVDYVIKPSDVAGIKETAKTFLQFCDCKKSGFPVQQA